MTSTTLCPYALRLDAYLDGDLAPDEARAFERHLVRCPACEQELALAGRLQAELATLESDACPDDVFDAALARIRTLERDRAPMPNRAARTRRRWLVGAGLGLAVLAAIPFLRPTPTEPYSAAEIAQARQDVELAFALLGETSRHTTALVREDAFGHSAAQIRDGLSLPR